MTRAHARMRGHRFGQRQDRAGGHDAIRPDDDGSIVKRRARHEERLEQFGGEIGVEHDPRLRRVLQPRLALEDDERPVSVGGEARGREGDLRRNALRDALLAGRQEPAQRAHAAEALEGAPELGLEDHHEGKQADHGARLEDLGQQLQAEELRGNVHAVHEGDADDEPHGAGVADQAEEPVDQEARERDVDNRGRRDLHARQEVRQLPHRRSIVAAAPWRPDRDPRRGIRRAYRTERHPGRFRG